MPCSAAPDGHAQSVLPSRGRRLQLATEMAGAIVVGSLLAVAPAHALDADTLAAQAGTYLIAPAAGGNGCHVTLGKGEAIGGHEATVDAGCDKVLPDLSDTSAWNFDDQGRLILIDALRHMLARFEEQEGGPYRSQAEPTLLLIADPGAITTYPSPSDMAGKWTLRRPGAEALCDMKLAADTLDSGMHPLSPASDCPSAIARLDFFRWQMNGLTLSLLGKDGSSLQFDADQGGRFVKNKREGGKPLELVRKP